jgi:XTP/dITP diphosphohydrolase
LATKNAGKVDELRDLFAGTDFAVATYDEYADVEEGETSYEENAALKARTLKKQLSASKVAAAVLGDDSGLEVSALGGRPGVLSARYAGVDATWSDRRERLLAEIAAAGSPDRTGRFVCALHYIDIDGYEIALRADVTGSVATRERGEGGFGYDPIFVPDGRDITFAEFPASEKNRASHRGRAVAALLETLASRSCGTARPA